MAIELLIQAIVRQTTILIAQLATSGGARAPLAQVANQVFLDLVTELERQGVSRKVSADMFGLGLRTYQRKIQRLQESSTERGRSLWEAILEYISSERLVTRANVQMRFARDEDAQVRGVLRDLSDSGLIFSMGQGPSTAYRVASVDELDTLRQMRSDDGLEELVWALVYREGPISKNGLASAMHIELGELEPILERLVDVQRIEVIGQNGGSHYKATSLYVPVGSAVGWEAAVFDHFQAVVKTICCRTRDDRTTATDVGGSTYTLDVWPGHPLEEEARATLSRLRGNLVDLRRRIEEFNAESGVPALHDQVVLYVGQCVIPQDQDETEKP
jgi:hypothetical protein